jgi:hypothetical protein
VSPAVLFYKDREASEEVTFADCSDPGVCIASFSFALFETVFFVGTFFRAAFFVVGVPGTALLFLATIFFAADLRVMVFFAAAFSDEAGLDVESPSFASAIRNVERSFALAIQAGARPRPLQVAPLSGSRYRAA